MDKPHEANQQLYPEVSYGPRNPAASAPTYGSTHPQAVPHPMYHHQQPPSYYQQTNNVVIQQPQAHTNPLMVTGFEGHRDWQSGICDCFNEPGICLLTCLCYPGSICYLGSRMGEHFCTGAIVPASDVALRYKLRTVGGIQGTLCSDCMTVLFCGPCAACQAHRELTKMGVP